MRTNIDIDEKLLADVMKATGAKTKREAIHKALEAAVRAGHFNEPLKQVHEIRTKRETKAQSGARLKRLRAAFKKVKGIGWEGDLEALRGGRTWMR